jgi:hypothetical protein
MESDSDSEVRIPEVFHCFDVACDREEGEVFW